MGMVLVFAGIGLGIWAIMDEENSDRFFEHGRQAGVLIFVSIGAGWLMRIVLITSHHCGKRKKVRRVSLLFPHHITLNAYRTTGSTLLTLCQR